MHGQVVSTTLEIVNRGTSAATDVLVAFPPLVAQVEIFFTFSIYIYFFEALGTRSSFSSIF